MERREREEEEPKGAAYLSMPHCPSLQNGNNNLPTSWGPLEWKMLACVMLPSQDPAEQIDVYFKHQDPPPPLRALGRKLYVSMTDSGVERTLARGGDPTCRSTHKPAAGQ